MHGLLSFLAVLVRIEVFLIIVRILISWFPDIDPWNPLVRALRMVVDPVLRPFRALLPSMSGIDFSPLLAIVVLRAVGDVLDVYSVGGSVDATRLAAGVLERLILDIVLIVIVVVLLRVLVSLFHADPWHPAVRFIRDMSSPLVRPFAGALPRMRAVDSAAVVALGVFIAVYFVAQWALDQLVLHI